MSTMEQNIFPRNKAGSPLAYVLAFVFALFISILIVVYFITRQSHPVMLDEHGKPLASSMIVPLDRRNCTIRL